MTAFAIEDADLDEPTDGDGDDTVHAENHPKLTPPDDDDD